MTKARDIVRRRIERGHHVDVDAHRDEQTRDFADIVAMPKAQRGRPEHIAARSPDRTGLRWKVGELFNWAGKISHQLIERFCRTPIFFALVRRQFERNHRDRQCQCLRQAAWVVLNQLGGARRTHQHRLRVKALKRLARRILEQLSRITAQIARLKGGVSHRRAFREPLDHGE